MNMDVTAEELSDDNSDVPSERQLLQSHSVPPAKRLSKRENLVPPAKRNLCGDDSDVTICTVNYSDDEHSEHIVQEQSDPPVEKYAGEHDSDVIVKGHLVEDTS